MITAKDMTRYKDLLGECHAAREDARGDKEVWHGSMTSQAYNAVHK